MDTLQYPLNLVGWQGSQVIELAKALVGTVNTASLNLTVVQIVHTSFCLAFHMFF